MPAEICRSKRTGTASKEVSNQFVIATTNHLSKFTKTIPTLTTYDNTVACIISELLLTSFANLSKLPPRGGLHFMSKISLAVYSILVLNMFNTVEYHIGVIGSAKYLISTLT